MGDPQAPFAKVLSVLDRHRLLGSDGQLKSDVQLISMGDHFDWGKPSERKQATEGATALLAWLAAHPPEQVILLLGNHDLARVCELFPFDDDVSFEAAFARASQAYADGDGRAEWLARDYSCYAAEQQRLVTELLLTHRFRAAHAHRGLLLTHAGVTDDDWALLGAQPENAEAAALQLNAFVDERVEWWEQGPLNLAPLYFQVSAQGAPARGIFCHRPAMPAEHQQAGRRYDPRRLSAAFPQAIGHVRDNKCRELLGSWAEAGTAIDGPLRSLLIDADAVQYRVGALPDARLYFLDGGLLQAAAERFQLFDLDLRAAVAA